MSLPYIESLKIQGFKSFKNAKIIFHKGLTVVTGPNGSGKSNILDAISFSLGIRRVRALRAGKIANLIRKGGSSCRVEIILKSGDGKIKVERIINSKGKSFFRFNGKRKSLSDVEFELSKFNIKPEGFNIVTQGDITLIIEMSQRERKELIEDLAGVKEFDIRKQKTLEELRIVEERLHEAEAILRERKVALDDAERNLRKLRRYQSLNDELKVLRGTRIKLEIEEKKKELSRLDSESTKIFDQKLLEHVEEKLKKLKSEYRSLSEEVDFDRLAEISKILADIELLKEKLKNLKKTEKRLRNKLSGIVSAPKEVKNVKGYIGLIGEIIKPMPGFEMAYNSVFGSKTSDIVVETVDDAFKLATMLKTILKRRLRIIPIKINPKKTISKEEEVGLGFLKDFLNYDQRFEGLVDLIAGDYIVVRSLQEIPRDLIGKYRFVTKDGEIVERNGSITIGLSGRLKAEKDKLRDVEKEIEAIKKKIEDEKRLVGDITLEKVNILSKKRRDLERRIWALNERRDELIKSKREHEQKLKDLEVRKTILKNEIARLSRELERYPKPLEGVNVRYVRERIFQIENELRSIGPINFDAERDYFKKLELYSDIKSKYESIKKEKEDIEDAIKTIEAKKNEVLNLSLKKLNASFQESYNAITGGSGQIVLTDEGLNIEVTLPNKHIRDIDSLSGGEKSIAALAFIMAVQRLKPAPFYIFDEADHMLDPKNCERYASLLKKLSKEAQVITVSLKKETISAADQVIGVTIRNGESKVVGIRMQ